MKPTVGRIVHYKALGSADGRYPPVCRAAMITDDEPVFPGTGSTTEGQVHLTVFNPEGMFFNKFVPYDASGKPGTWHWPERTE